MAQNLRISPSFSHRSIRDELKDRGPEIKMAVIQLCDTATPPIGDPGLLSVCVGAEKSFAAAMTLLNEPNALALDVHAQLVSLAHACQEIYTERNFVDVRKALKRSLKAYPGWCALAEVGMSEISQHSGELAAMGVNFGLAWIKKKAIAEGYMTLLRTRVPDSDLTIDALLDQISPESPGKTTRWLRDFGKFLTAFRENFDCRPNDPPKPKTFEEKAVSEWLGRSAFSSFRRRAAILDKTCLSQRQIKLACKHSGFSGFQSAAERRIVMWLVGFSGLNTETVHRLPICNSPLSPIPENWVAYYDVASGILLRDYSALAHEAASVKGHIAEPASYVCPLPAPEEIANDIRALLKERGPANTFGELLPALAKIQTEWSLYPSRDELLPSWAKWSRTLGPYMRQLGLDNFLTGILLGDLGQTAASKMFYALVEATELWATATKVYASLGWGVPVAQPLNRMAFGSQVVPSSTAISVLDSANLEIVTRERPRFRCSVEKDLAFHRLYTIAVAFRLMLLLALRAAKIIPISAAVDEDFDLTIDLTEKGSAGRSGGMAAILTDIIANEIRTYRKHCFALRNRLKNRGMKGAAIDWLDAVVNKVDVPLLSEINDMKSVSPLSTHTVLTAVCGDQMLAKDFGRKWTENALRNAGFNTSGIDRVMRHEVLGQETTTAVADGCERVWVHRMRAVLNRVHAELFVAPLWGLRKE